MCFGHDHINSNVWSASDKQTMECYDDVNSGLFFNSKLRGDDDHFHTIPFVPMPTSLYIVYKKENDFIHNIVLYLIMMFL